MQLVNYVILLTEAAFIHKRPPPPALPLPPPLIPQPLMSVSFCLSAALSIYLSPLSLSVLRSPCPQWEAGGLDTMRRTPQPASSTGRKWGALGDTGASLFLMQCVSVTQPSGSGGVGISEPSPPPAPGTGTRQASDLRREAVPAAGPGASPLPPSLPSHGHSNRGPACEEKQAPSTPWRKRDLV